MKKKTSNKELNYLIRTLLRGRPVYLKDAGQLELLRQRLPEADFKAEAALHGSLKITMTKGARNGNAPDQR